MKKTTTTEHRFTLTQADLKKMVARHIFDETGMVVLENQVTFSWDEDYDGRDEVSAVAIVTERN